MNDICQGCNKKVIKTIPNTINGKRQNLGKCCFVKYRPWLWKLFKEFN